MNEIIKIEKTVNIESKIISLPGRPNAMLDSDLAGIYDTDTSVINRAVKRNFERFPDDFYFQATDIEVEIIKCQIGTLHSPRANPHLFTHNGANMLSAVLHTPIAIERSIQINRAFSEMESRIALGKLIPKNYPEALRALAVEVERRVEAEKIIEEQAPKVAAYEDLINSDGLFTLTEAGKLINKNPNKFTELLRKKKILYYRNGVNIPTQRYLNVGYFEVKAVQSSGGSYTQTYVTGRGLGWLKRRMIPETQQSIIFN